MARHSKTFEIRVSDLDFNGELSQKAIMNYMNEVGQEADRLIGNTLEKYNEEGYTWILYRWKINFENKGFSGDKISVTTWISNIDKFMTRRQYYVVNSYGVLIAKATTIWTLLDSEKRTLIRIPNSLKVGYPIDKEEFFEEFYPFKDKLPERYNNTTGYDVMFRDIDYNLHVNNLSYVDWIIDSVPLYLLKFNRVKTMEIIYKKEVKYEDKVCVKSVFTTGSKFNIYSRICNLDDKDFALALIEII